jgi:hypothetical protein
MKIDFLDKTSLFEKVSFPVFYATSILLSYSQLALLAWAAARNSCCCSASFSCLVADQLAFRYAVPTHTLCFPSLCRHEFRQCAGVGSTGSSPLSTSMASPQLALAGCSFWASFSRCLFHGRVCFDGCPFQRLGRFSSDGLFDSSSSTRVLCVSGAFRARILPSPTGPSSAPPPSTALRDQFLDSSLAEGSPRLYRPCWESWGSFARAVCC